MYIVQENAIVKLFLKTECSSVWNIITQSLICALQLSICILVLQQCNTDLIQGWDCEEILNTRERIYYISNKNEGKYVHPALHMCAPLQWLVYRKFPSDNNMATVPQKMWAFNVVGGVSRGANQSGRKGLTRRTSSNH